jgi:hypothetical protein
VQQSPGGEHRDFLGQQLPELEEHHPKVAVSSDLEASSYAVKSMGRQVGRMGQVVEHLPEKWPGKIVLLSEPKPSL